jgi:hypothetical protein
MENIYVEDMQNNQEIFKRKQKVFQLFNYDPFVEKIHLVNGVLKRNEGVHEFYQFKKPPNNHQMQLLAIVEVIHESEIAHLLGYLKKPEMF